MSRRERDFYPTPPDAVAALMQASWPRNVLSHQRWLDPAAGAGALLRSVGAGVHDGRYAIELFDGFRDQLAEVADEVVIGDALAMDWPDGCNIIANPPFSLLEPFVQRIVDYCKQWKTIGICLTRLQWLDDGAGRHRRFRPDQVLRMPWRISFDGRGTESTTHCWLVWWRMELHPTVTTWLDRPKVSDEDWERHQAMVEQSGAARRQLSLNV